MDGETEHTQRRSDETRRRIDELRAEVAAALRRTEELMERRRRQPRADRGER